MQMQRNEEIAKRKRINTFLENWNVAIVHLILCIKVMFLFYYIDYAVIHHGMKQGSILFPSGRLSDREIIKTLHPIQIFFIDVLNSIQF